MSSTLLRWALVLMVATFGIKVLAHTRLKVSGTLVPRSTDPGIKMGPCGPAPRLANPAVFVPGATIVVNWEETIDHPGRFEFYFSTANDANFGTPIKTVIDTLNTPINGGSYHQYTTTLTLPNVTCAACTLQMIQVMTESNPPSLYYSCADIALVGPNGPPAPVPTPTPVPGAPPLPAPLPAPLPSPVTAPNCKSH